MDKKFDVNLLNKRTGYDTELLNEIFLIFKSNYKEYFVLLRKFFEKNDWQGVSGVAHRAKSSVAIMGMETVSQVFEDIEINASDGSEIENFEMLINQLQNDVDNAVLQIEAYIQTLNSENDIK